MTLPHQFEPRTLWRAFWISLLTCAAIGALAPGQTVGVRLLMPPIVVCVAAIGFSTMWLGLRIHAIIGNEWFPNAFRWLCLLCFYMMLMGAITVLFLGPLQANDPEYQLNGLVWPQFMISLPSALGAAFGAYRVFDTECF